jgi:hypothetical protein
MRHQDEPGWREPHMNKANGPMLLFLHNCFSLLFSLLTHEGADAFNAPDLSA